MSSLQPAVAVRPSDHPQTALADAEASGKKRARVIVRLRSGGNLDDLKYALLGRSLPKAFCESESFLALQLSREELLQISKLTRHVSHISLDRPVSTAR